MKNFTVRTLNGGSVKVTKLEKGFLLTVTNDHGLGYSKNLKDVAEVIAKVNEIKWLTKEQKQMVEFTLS